MSVPLIGQRPEPQPLHSFRHIHGEPNPSPQTATQTIPGHTEDGQAQVVFISSGGMTVFESAAMKLAGDMISAHGAGFPFSGQIAEIAESAVNLTAAIFAECRKVADPYQGGGAIKVDDEKPKTS